MNQKIRVQLSGEHFDDDFVHINTNSLPDGNCAFELCIVRKVG